MFLSLRIGELWDFAAQQRAEGVVAEAVDFAEQSPEPEPKELYTDILVETY